MSTKLGLTQHELFAIAILQIVLRGEVRGFYHDLRLDIRGEKVLETRAILKLNGSLIDSFGAVWFYDADFIINRDDQPGGQWLELNQEQRPRKAPLPRWKNGSCQMSYSKGEEPTQTAHFRFERGLDMSIILTE